MLTAAQNYRRLQEVEADRAFILMAYRRNPELIERAESRSCQLFALSDERDLPDGGGPVATPWLLATVPPAPLPAKTKSSKIIRHKGFTMIELIVTMILIGILAAVALPRVNLINGFDEIGYRDQVIATLEFARKSAVAARRYVCAQRVGNSISLTIDSAIPEGRVAADCPRQQNLSLPGSGANLISPRGATALGGFDSVVFDPLGRATLTGGVNLTVTGDSVTILTVDVGTGYVN